MAASAGTSSETIERIEPGQRVSMAVAYGPTVYLAGQVARNAGGGSVAEQTRDILSTIDNLLSKAGTDKPGCSRPISGSPTSAPSTR